MSNRKSLLVLLLLTVGLAVVNLTMLGNASKSVDEVVSLIDNSVNYDRIVITKKNMPAIVLEKPDIWKLSSPYIGNADGEKVLRLLDAMAFTRISDLVSDEELLKMGRTRADFALDDPSIKVSLSAGEDLTTVSFGAPTPSADGIYATVDDKPAVFVVPLAVMEAVDVSPDAFRRRSLFLLEPDSVLSFDIKSGRQSTISFLRNGDGWVLRGGKQVSTTKVRQLLGELMAFKISTFVWPVGATNESEVVSASLLSSYGLDPDGATTITLKCTDGVDRQISFGLGAGKDSVYSLVHNGSAIVTLPIAMRDLALKGSVELADQRLFPLDKPTISTIRLEENGVVCTLSKGEGNDWFMETPIRAPAEASVVNSMLDRMLALTTRDQVASGVSLSVSTSAVPVVVSRQSVLGDATLEHLRSKVIASFAVNDVKRLVFISGEKESKPVSVLYNHDRGNWNVESAPEGSRVNEDGIAAILKAIACLRAERVERLSVSGTELRNYGLDVPSITFAIDKNSGDAVRRNVLIGDKTEGGRFATIGSADAIFVISDDVAEVLANPLVIK